jgi:hypothetical protein
MTKYKAYIFLFPHLIFILTLVLIPNLEFRNNWLNINSGALLSISSLLFFSFFIISWKQNNLFRIILGCILTLVLAWYSLTYFKFGRYLIECNQKTDFKILEVYTPDSTDMLIIQKSIHWKNNKEIFDTNRIHFYGPFKLTKTINEK